MSRTAPFPALMTPYAFEQRLREVLSAEPLAHQDDHTPFGCHVIAGLPLEPHLFETARPAAVLVPILVREGRLSVLLTERAAHLKTHAGQVSFPGGRIEPGETPLEAALREAREEIGLDSAYVRPVGYLPPYFSGTGFRVQPLVALVDSAAPFVPDANEVARIFEIPFDLVTDLARFKLGTIFWRGNERRFYVMDFDDAYIWGVTAGILRSFAERF
jgi:8-oxo-dGTP pyrophosphatase MutT (NUDIX family)